MAYLLKFGSYQFPITFYPKSDARSADVQVVKVPRRDGAVALPRTLKEKKVTIEGGFVENQAGIGSVRTAIDALLGALATGPANLQFEDDRYWRQAQALEPLISYSETLYGEMAAVTVDLVTADPFQYALTASSDTWNSPVNANNNPATQPTLTASGSGSGLSGGTYSAGYTYSTASAGSETQISPLATITITAGQRINITAPAIPSGYSYVNFYLSTAVGNSTMGLVQGSSTTTTFSAGTAGSQPPTTSPTIHSLNNAVGNAYALPQITITLSAAGAVAATITNTSTGEAFTLTGTAPGTAIVVDCLAQTVSCAGADAMFLFDGIFPRLLPGSNIFTALWNPAQAAVSLLGWNWSGRWY